MFFRGVFLRSGFGCARRCKRRRGYFCSLNYQKMNFFVTFCEKSAKKIGIQFAKPYVTAVLYG